MTALNKIQKSIMVSTSIALILSSSIILPAFGAEVRIPEASIQKGIIGDINGDKIINSNDVVFLKRYLLGYEDYQYIGNRLWEADVNGDETIDSTDLNYLKRRILGIMNVFPKELNSIDVKVPKISAVKGVNIVKMALNYVNTLALTDEGKVVLWGRNYDKDSIIPDGLEDIKDIAAGEFHYLALKKDGTVVAWGQNDRGQCNVPPDLSGVKSVVAQGDMSVALKENGSVVVWGGCKECLKVPEVLGDVKQIACGANIVAVLFEDGTVMQWGVSEEADKNKLSDVKTLVGGLGWIVALKNDGTVVELANQCFNENTLGELSGIAAITGGGSTIVVYKSDGSNKVVEAFSGNSMQIPQNVPQLSAFYCGNGRILGLTKEGEVFGWGQNMFCHNEIFPDLSDIKQMDSFLGVVALKNDGSVVYWGYNYNNMGHFSQAIKNVNTGFKKVAISNETVACLKEDGKVWIYGDNHEGYFNLPEELDEIIDIDICRDEIILLDKNGIVHTFGDRVLNDLNEIKNVKCIDTGYLHCVALLNDGTVKEFVAEGLKSNIPEGLEDIISVSAGSYHSMALKKDGTVVGWTISDSEEYKVPEGMKNVVEIAAGTKHCVALKADGTIEVWGEDDGHFSSLRSLKGVKSISAGDKFTAVIMEDGTTEVYGNASFIGHNIWNTVKD